MYQQGEQRGRFTPSRTSLCGILIPRLSILDKAVREGVTVTEQKPRDIKPKPFAEWLGMDKIPSVRNVALGGGEGQSVTTPEAYQPGDPRLITSEPGQPLAEETVASPSPVSPTQPAGPVQELKTPPSDSGEVDCSTAEFETGRYMDKTRRRSRMGFHAQRHETDAPLRAGHTVRRTFRNDSRKRPHKKNLFPEAKRRLNFNPLRKYPQLARHWNFIMYVARLRVGVREQGLSD